MTVLILLLIAAVLTSGGTIPTDHHIDESCGNVTIPECEDFARVNNYSVVPSSSDVSSAFRDVRRLFNSGCSQYIKILVCIMLEPTCHEHRDQVKLNHTDTVINVSITFKAFACKRFCEGVRSECALYNAFWTSDLDCSTLPDSQICFTPPDFVMPTVTATRAATPVPSPTAVVRSETTTSTKSTPSTSTDTSTDEPSTNGPSTNTPSTTGLTSTNPQPTVATGSSNINATSIAPITCPGRLVPYQGVSYGGIDDCAAPCHYLYEGDRYSSGLVTFLFILWTILSVLTIVSFMSFLLTWKHYSHIERPYHFLVLCHALLLLAFLIRLGSGHDGVVCDGRHTSFNDTALVTKDVSNAACTAVFIIVYYSIMAISTWLVNLSIALCTRTLLKWKHYLLAGYHLAGWGIPLIFVITASVLQMASGDELLGICQLDHQYLPMVLVWITVCAGLSFILLLFAVFQMLFCSQSCVEVQHVHKHPGRLLRSLMLGVFVLIEICIISVLYFIEYVSYEHWEKYYTQCVVENNSDCERTFAKPSYAIPILRYSLISVVGAVSIVWPLTRRVTWKSWKDSATLLYQKIATSFQFLRECSWRNKSPSVIHVQMESVQATVETPV